MIRYRVDPALHVHIDFDAAAGERRLLIDHLRHTTRFEPLSPAGLRALDAAREPLSEEQCLARLHKIGLSAERAQDFFDDALAYGLLEPLADGDAMSAPPAAFGAEWKLRFAKAHQPYLDYRTAEAREAEEALMVAYRGEDAPPAIYKDYPGAAVVELEDGDGAAPVVWTREWLSRFLRTAFGATGLLQDPVQGSFLLKTHPSGGARHPLECYLSCNGVRGVPAGLYHYSVRSHALELLDGCVAPADVSPLRVILTALPERVMWRYREPSSFCVMMLDLGHALENFTWALRDDGIGSEVLLDVDASAWAAALRLPLFEELPLAMIRVIP